MMSTTIFLIRHGETSWNRRKIFRGTADIPLNDTGRAQARHLANVLASRRIDAAYSSPLSRATETAQIILEPHGIVAKNSDGLRDIDYGAWTGIEDDEVARRWPDEHACWGRTPHTMRLPDGDMLIDVFKRAMAAVEDIAQHHQGQTIVVVAHRVVNKLLVLGMLTLGLERFPFIRQDNCCLNEFERIDRGYIVISLNDTHHIRHTGTALLSADF